ncbi:MAG: UvrB/UvrC motif-containing protein [Phycisphaerae bacterium]|jgi:protein arginine kinase activator|nr:UvrB/UvrC motif-containing protein [Phycisphaerae bacterium]
MLCQRCGKNVATVHLTEIAKQQRRERHLCEDCAKAEGVFKLSQVSVQDVLSAFLTAQKPVEGAEKIVCPDCGMNYKEFRSAGRLGCPGDYDVFEDVLLPAIEKMHGEAKHVGKIPKRARTDEHAHRQLMEVRRQLAEAVAAENYEEAARLRDIIRTKGGTGGD